LQRGKVSRGRKGKDRLNFRGKRTKASGGYMMTKAINLRDSECTFSRIDVEAVGSHHVKDLAKVEDMLRTAFAENEDVIEVHKNERKGTEEGVHEPLKHLSSIFEAERHEIKFEKSKWGDYCRLRNVVFAHGYLIVPFLEIEF
jgi:hypothetical protein